MVRVPLVDVGPAEDLPSGAEVDLTMACDQFLKTIGTRESGLPVARTQNLTPCVACVCVEET